MAAIVSRARDTSENGARFQRSPDTSQPEVYWEAAMADSNQSSITPNLLIEHLLRESSDKDEIVELRGYVGSSTPDVVRLNKDLSASRYLEIPRGAIIHSSYEGDPTTCPLKLYVRGSTSIV